MRLLRRIPIKQKNNTEKPTQSVYSDKVLKANVAFVSRKSKKTHRKSFFSEQLQEKNNAEKPTTSFYSEESMKAKEACVAR